MKVSLRLLPAAIVAALLAACSGGGNTTLPQSSVPQALPQQPPSVNAFNIVEDGESVPGTHLFPTVENATGGSYAAMMRRAQAGNPLLYGGGPVQHNAKIYLVLWQFNSNDPNGEQTRLTNFIKGIGGSQWASSQSQYHDNSGSIVNDAALAGTWNDNTNSIPSRPSQSAVAAEAARAAAHFGNYSTDAMYFIALEKGHDPSGFRTQWCAFHSTTSASGHTIAYTDFPYTSDAGASCGANSVNSNGTEDGVTIVGGHEIYEAVTDPQPSSGWVDASGAETGDKCAWTNLQNTSFSTGTFPTQPLWSNSANGCVQ